MTATAPYIGRFAPTPSGHLHFGSLVAALASYLDARAVDGRWLLRMEDLDPPREEPGAQAAILKALESYGFEWDGEMVRQSERHDAYDQVINRLFSQGLAYACTCSRKRVANMLRGLGSEEVDSLIAERGEAEVGCDFCGAQYRFDAVDAGELFAPGQPPGSQVVN